MYTKYWTQLTINERKATVVPSIQTAESVLMALGIDTVLKQFQKTLDLGCSFGRMYSLLDGISHTVCGLDLESSAVEAASNLGYADVALGSASSIPYEDSSFDFIFCWAVFDALTQGEALTEANRVMVNGGLMLVTGKNASYRHDGSQAIVAELAAKENGFIGHYTLLWRLVEALPDLGFEVVQTLRFEKRNDFALMKIMENYSDDMDYYEYVILLKKVRESLETGKQDCAWDLLESQTLSGRSDR